MVTTETELARAIMNKDYRIYIDDALIGGIQKIQNPSEVAFKSVAAALVTSAFFWGGPCAAALGFAVGLPAILAVCGGVGGVVFVTLGASGTLCAFRMLMEAKDINVLHDLRNRYELKDGVLIRK